MFLHSPFIEPEDHWVTVWLGQLNSDELEQYMHKPGGAGDNDPISDFSRDLGRWYDHDYIWRQATDKAVSTRTLCELNGINDSLVDEIECRSGDVFFKCLLVLWNSRVITMDKRVFAGGELTCLGSWPHESPITDEY